MSHNEVRERLKEADDLRKSVRTLESLARNLRTSLITSKMHWYDGLLWWRDDHREGAQPRQQLTREEAGELSRLIPALVAKKRKAYEALEATVAVTEDKPDYTHP